MTPNTEMINKLISHLRKVGGDHFYMSKFATRAGTWISSDVDRYEPCQTAFCVAGWVNVLTTTDDNLKAMSASQFEAFVSNASQAARLLQIGDFDAEKLFSMHGSVSIDMRTFDKLPDDYRLNAGIRVLEILRDKHVVDWDRAIRETVPKHVVDSAFYSAYGYLPEGEDSEQYA